MRPGRGRRGDDLPAGVRLRQDQARVAASRRRRTDAEVADTNIHLILTGDLPLGVDGPDARARHRMKRREALQRPLLGAEADPPESVEDCESGWDERRLLARWLEAGSFPDHPWRGPSPALRPDAEGPDVLPDRRRDRRAHHLAAGDPRRRAQLGLPLHLDPGRHLHPLGDAHPRLRLRGDRLHGLVIADIYRENVTQGSSAADHVRDRRRAGPGGVDRSTTSRATRARGRFGSGTPRTSSGRTTSTGPCSTPSTSTPRSRIISPMSCGRRSPARSKPPTVWDRA